MENELQDLVAAWSAYGRQQPPLQQAYGSMSADLPRVASPMQGNSGAGWGGPANYVSNPDSSDWYRQAPGYRPGTGSMTPEAQAEADRQWELRQQPWDEQEHIRNTLQDASLAQARQQDQQRGAGWANYQRVMAQPYTRPRPPLNNYQGGMQSNAAPTGQPQPAITPSQHGMLHPAILAYIMKLLQGGE